MLNDRIRSGARLKKSISPLLLEEPLDKLTAVNGLLDCVRVATEENDFSHLPGLLYFLYESNCAALEEIHALMFEPEPDGSGEA